MFGAMIGEKHTYTDFGLKMTSYSFPKPKPKLEKIQIPYASGSIDLTEAGGIIAYNDRDNIKMEFIYYDGTFASYEAATQELAMYLQGKQMKVIIDSDPGYYYMARLAVSASKSKKALSKIVIEGTADPFKYDLTASDEDWLWDPFNFETGVIRVLASINITPEHNTILIEAGGLPAVPEFIISNPYNLVMSYAGKSYEFPEPGTYRFPKLRIGSTDAELTFTGTGKVTVRYRGLYL